MLLLNPIEEQEARMRIALAKELFTPGLDPKEAERRKDSLVAADRALDVKMKEETFRKASADYWSQNEIQVRATLRLLDEMKDETRKLAALSKATEKRGKPSDPETMRKNLYDSMNGISKLVPAGAQTGEEVRKLLGAWGKLKGTREIIAFLRVTLDDAEAEARSLGETVLDEKKKLEAAEKSFRANKPAKGEKPWDGIRAQRAKVEGLSKRYTYVKSEVSRKKKALLEAQNSVPELIEEIRSGAQRLSEISGRVQKGSPNSGKPVMEILLENSLPHIRAGVARAALGIPVDVLEKRQAEAMSEYEKIAKDYEQEALRAKARARCKQCREAVDSLMSGASNRDAEPVKRCARLLDDGDIFEARKALDEAISTGVIQSYTIDALKGKMAELEKVYDEKGAVSKVREKLKAAGSAMFRARLDLMRLEFIKGGVHAAREFWKAADETFRWLKSAGMVFDESLEREIAEAKEKPDFILISDMKGFGREQTENAERMSKMLANEAYVLSMLGNSEGAAGIAKSERTIGAIVAANDNFSNKLFLKSLLFGNKQAVVMKDRVMGESGDFSDALAAYLDAAIKREALDSVQRHSEHVSALLASLKSLCDELWKLKSTVPKSAKAGREGYSATDAVSRKASEIDSLIKEITGHEASAEIRAKAEDPAITGSALYSEIISRPEIAGAFEKEIGENFKALRTIASSKV